MSLRLVRPVRLSSILRTTFAVTFLTLSLAVTSQQRPASNQSQSAVQVPAVAKYGELPLAFEANRGQADSSVRFLAHGNGYSLLLTDSGAVLALRKPVDCGLRKSLPGARPLACPATASVQQDVVRLRLAGASAGARAEAAGPKAAGEEKLPGRVNYFIGNDPAQWQTGVPTYAKVRYSRVYPGVDLVYYGNQRQLEYDFVVAPGADPARIALALTSARSARIDAATGDLVITADQGELRLLKPATYQLVHGKRVSIPSSFKLTRENEVAFAVGAHDLRLPLVIDPMLTYSTYLGGSGNDSGNAIAVDASGSAYVTGSTNSADFPTLDPLQTKNGNAKNGTAFVTKFTPDGSGLVYSTYLGGTGGDSGMGIAVDADGNAYITGTTKSSDFPLMNPLQSTNKGAASGQSTVFVTKINPTGSALVFSTYLGGSGNDSAAGIAIDREQNVYVGGTTFSTDFPLQNPVQSTNNSAGIGGSNAFVAEISAPGSALVYSTYLGGSGFGNDADDTSGGGGDSASGIAVDAEGEAVVAGTAFSTDFPVSANAFQPQNYTTFVNPNTYSTDNGTQGFVTKYTADGSRYVFSTYFGGGGFIIDNCEGPVGAWGDAINAVALDVDGNIYVTGSTRGGVATKNPIQGFFGVTTTWYPVDSIIVSDTNAFVSEFKPDGSALLFSTPFGGDGIDTTCNIELASTGGCGYDGHFCPYEVEGNGDVGTGIAVDLAGSIYVTGNTGSTDFPVLNPVGYVTSGNAFISKLHSSGLLIYSSYYGGGGESATGVAVDALRNAYITGSTPSGGLPTSSDAFQPELKGPSDAYVAKITIKGTPQSIVFNPPELTFGTPTNLTRRAFASSGLPVQYAVVYGQATLKGNVVTPPWTGTVTLEAYQLGNSTFEAAAARKVIGVNAFTLSVVAQNASMIYGGVLPKLRYAPIAGVRNDNCFVLVGTPSLSTMANSSSRVGTHPITVTQGTLAADEDCFGYPYSNPNYAFAFKNASLTVKKAELIVTANSSTIHQGQRIKPELTFTITGFRNGDKESVVRGAPILSTKATDNSLPGRYEIVVKLGTLSARNYKFREVDGWITIVK